MNYKNKKFWTKEEDDLLSQTVNTVRSINDSISWPLVSDKMMRFYKQGLITYKSSKQCRDRWVNYINCDASSDPKEWTQEEDLKVIELNNKYGNKWTRIASYLDQRTEFQVKHRYYSLYRKKLGEIIRQIVSTRNLKIKHDTLKVLSSKLQSGIKYSRLTPEIVIQNIGDSIITESINCNGNHNINFILPKENEKTSQIEPYASLVKALEREIIIKHGAFLYGSSNISEIHDYAKKLIEIECSKLLC